MEALTSAQVAAIRVTVQAGTGLSLLGSLFIVAVYLSFQDLRCYAFRLVLYLSVLDFLHGLWYFLPTTSACCLVQGLFTSYFSLASILMTAVIAYALYESTLREQSGIQALDNKFLICVLVPPMVGAFLPLITDSYGDVGGWCWIKLSREDFWAPTVWRLVTFYLPLWTVIAFNTFVYYRVIRKVNELYQQSNLMSSERVNVLYGLLWYPLALMGSYVLLTVERALESAHPGDESFPLMLVAGLFMSLNGFFNAVAYGFTASVRYRLLVVCCPHRRLSVVYSRGNTEKELGSALT